MNHCETHRCDPVFVSLSLADGDFAALEVEVLDPQAQRFEQPQPAAVLTRSGGTRTNPLPIQSRLARLPDCRGA
jgi:hypothetical protein